MLRFVDANRVIISGETKTHDGSSTTKRKNHFDASWGGAQGNKLKFMITDTRGQSPLTISIHACYFGCREQSDKKKRI